MCYLVGVKLFYGVCGGRVIVLFGVMLSVNILSVLMLMCIRCNVGNLMVVVIWCICWFLFLVIVSLIYVVGIVVWQWIGGLCGYSVLGGLMNLVWYGWVMQLLRLMLWVSVFRLVGLGVLLICVQQCFISLWCGFVMCVCSVLLLVSSSSFLLFVLSWLVVYMLGVLIQLLSEGCVLCVENW